MNYECRNIIELFLSLNSYINGYHLEMLCNNYHPNLVASTEDIYVAYIKLVFPVVPSNGKSEIYFSAKGARIT